MFVSIAVLSWSLFISIIICNRQVRKCNLLNRMDHRWTQKHRSYLRSRSLLTEKSINPIKNSWYWNWKSKAQIWLQRTSGFSSLPVCDALLFSGFKIMQAFSVFGEGYPPGNLDLHGLSLEVSVQAWPSIHQNPYAPSTKILMKSSTCPCLESGFMSRSAY